MVVLLLHFGVDCDGGVEHVRTCFDGFGGEFLVGDCVHGCLGIFVCCYGVDLLDLHERYDFVMPVSDDPFVRLVDGFGWWRLGAVGAWLCCGYVGLCVVVFAHGWYFGVGIFGVGFVLVPERDG